MKDLKIKVKRQIPFGIIMFTEGSKVQIGKFEFAAALSKSKKRAIKSSAAMAL